MSPILFFVVILVNKLFHDYNHGDMLTINIRICVRWERRRTGKERERRVKESGERPRHSFFGCVQEERERLQRSGCFSTASNYRTALNSFRTFRHDKDLDPRELSAEMMGEYERWLRGRGISSNTSSCYMRILRAVYNKAVERGWTRQRAPFKKIYTGVGTTVKRKLGREMIHRLESLSLATSTALRLARDLFLFSFLACGMPFVDLAYLKKGQIREEYLTYRRHKTGKQVRVRLDDRMERIIRHYASPDREYVFPILNNPANPRQAYEQYRASLCRHNRLLKKLAVMAGCPMITSYAARHSWASQAYEENVALATISKALGHTQARTTQLYIHEIDDSALEKAQHLVSRKIFDNYQLERRKRKRGNSVQELNSQ